MSIEPTIIRKKKLIYVLNPESIIVFVGFNQWVSYDFYNNYNRADINKFKQIILSSKIDEYDSATDQMSLAYECKIRGVSATKPKGVEL